jgi:excinuclease UvrABC ATPase subunit
MEKRSSSSSQSSLEVGQNMYRVDSKYCREPDSSQLNSAPRPSTNIEGRRTSSKTPHEYEPATPGSSNAKSPEGSRSSQSTNRNEFPRLNSLTTPQPATNAPTHDHDKMWASRRITEIQVETQTLKHDNDTRVIIIHQIEKEVSDVKKQNSELQEQKQEEIARVLREIEARYKREQEALVEKRNSLNEAKEREMEGLKENARQVKMNEKKMKRLQALVDLDDDSEDS